MKNILLVNACVKRDVDSRTCRLAQAYLKKSLDLQDYSLLTVNLEDTVYGNDPEKILSDAIEKMYRTL